MSAGVQVPPYYRLWADHPLLPRAVMPSDLSATLNHAAGSVVDYAMRAGRKPGEDWRKDLGKARHWVEIARDALHPRYSFERLVQEHLQSPLRDARMWVADVAQDLSMAMDNPGRRFVACDRLLDALGALALQLQSMEINGDGGML